MASAAAWSVAFPPKVSDFPEDAADCKFALLIHFGFDAARQLNLARLFKAGSVNHLICVAVATLEVARISIVATRRHFVNPN